MREWVIWCFQQYFLKLSNWKTGGKRPNWPPQWLYLSGLAFLGRLGIWRLRWRYSEMCLSSVDVAQMEIREIAKLRWYEADPRLNCADQPKNEIYDDSTVDLSSGANSKPGRRAGPQAYRMLPQAVCASYRRLFRARRKTPVEARGRYPSGANSWMRALLTGESLIDQWLGLAQHQLGRCATETDLGKGRMMGRPP